MGFVHLHLHTQYSLLDGANKVSELIPKISQLGMPAVAMTDHGNMFGAVDFYSAAEAAGIQPIIGCEAYVAPKSRFDKSQARSDDPETAGNYHLVLLSMNEKGYRNLCKLVSSAYKEGFYYKPRIDRELLEEFNEGLLCLSGCLGSEVNQAIQRGDVGQARRVASEFATIFDKDRYYIEVQDNHLAEQEVSNRELFSIAKELGLPLVATNDCHYLGADDAEAHEALLCIQTGKTLDDPNRWKFGTDQLFVKSPEQMRAAFPQYPEAIDNTLNLAKRCDFKMSFGQYEFPDYALPEGVSLEAQLREESRAGLDQRLARLRKDSSWDESMAKAYDERLEVELGVIENMGFPGYFLIVADFIQWSKRNDIPVGPGRGSAAGSVVAWAMQITDINPIVHGLLFERFLNPERKSMPDIDVDFCYERRDEVLQYVREKYGEDRVAQIITFGTLKGKAALKDVGRVLEFGYGETDKMAKLYPAARQGRDVPLKQALETESRLADIRAKGPREEKLFAYALRLEGLMRHASKHAAGVVIGAKPLVESVPLCVDKEGVVLTQYQGTDVEKVGLIKFDFLGLKTLTMIQDAVNRIRDGKGVKIDLANLPLDDKKTYRLLGRGETVGIFQMESSGMAGLVKRLKPKCFEDIVALNALYRPGPLESGIVDNFIDRKHGREVTVYPHPLLEPVLKETYGVMVYQEQVMQAARVLAGYSLGDADNLRRAMGKKKLEVMAKERNRFNEGAAKNNLDEKRAGDIFDTIEKFAGYGFNKSHAAAYALISFQTAYLKAHYPEEFIAALMTLEMGDADKTHKNIAEARAQKIPILPPDVNESRENFTVTGEKIRFGLGAVKGIGAKAIQTILAERDENGPFDGLDHMVCRITSTHLNRRVLESLVKCGAFDSTGVDRASLLANVEGLIRWASHAAANINQGNLFVGGGKGGRETYTYQRVDPWGAEELLRQEKETLGFFITGHPLDRYRRQLKKLITCTTMGLQGQPAQQKVTLAGVVQGLKLKNSKKGDRYATFFFEDLEGIVEVIAWPEAYRRNEALIASSEPLSMTGKLDIGDDRCQIIADQFVRLDEARARAIRELKILIDGSQFTRADLERLGQTLARYPGNCPTYLHVKREAFETRISLEKHGVATNHELIAALAERLTGVEARFVS